jgi:hypothetical protein
MLISVIYILGLVTIWSTYLLSGPTLYCFIVFFAVSLYFHRPKDTFSPLTIFYAYYGAWFVFAPLFATRYQDVLLLPQYNLALAFAYSVFGLGLISMNLGTQVGLRLSLFSTRMSTWFQFKSSPVWMVILYVLSTAMVCMVVLSSGGFAKWMANPGDAFLERAGAGVYVILSHFFTTILATIIGFYSYWTRKKSHVIGFIFWVLLTSPVHGSKLQISLFILIVLIPWLRNMKLWSGRSVAVYVTLVTVFFLGLYFRNFTWISLKTFIPYSLNYFTALENLALSIKDFDPGFMTTFFLPFVKFQTPFGLARPDMYYDMNHLLTDIYVPTAWKIRATEQWPVETDLYLNFMFFGGLPVIAVYLFVVGFFYGRALKTDSLGHWVASFLMTILLVSHMRGSLINHTDFYMYPFILFLLFLFKDVYFRKKSEL